MSNYSKAARGLSVFPKLNGIFTVFAISPRPCLRQFPYHYAIRAGQNLPDKEFRYLRTVIVTAAVHQGLDSKREPLLLTFWHWAGVSPYTYSCEFAETCVFDKQLHGHIRCGQQTKIEINVYWQGLSRSYSCFFAEFLKHGFLDHLSILNLSTSVGLRYGNLFFSLPRFFLLDDVIRITSTKSKYFASQLVNSNRFT